MKMVIISFFCGLTLGGIAGNVGMLYLLSRSIHQELRARSETAGPANPAPANKNHNPKG